VDLRHEEGSKTSRDKDRRYSSLKMKSQKPDVPIWDFGWFSFLRIDRARLGFEI
jgi:hypothetical protein